MIVQSVYLEMPRACDCARDTIALILQCALTATTAVWPLIGFVFHAAVVFVSVQMTKPGADQDQADDPDKRQDHWQ